MSILTDGPNYYFRGIYLLKDQEISERERRVPLARKVTKSMVRLVGWWRRVEQSGAGWSRNFQEKKTRPEGRKKEHSVQLRKRN